MYLRNLLSAELDLDLLFEPPRTPRPTDNVGMEEHRHHLWLAFLAFLKQAVERLFLPSAPVVVETYEVDPVVFGTGPA
jgi:hypothetical protein